MDFSVEPHFRDVEAVMKLLKERWERLRTQRSLPPLDAGIYNTVYESLVEWWHES